MSDDPNAQGTTGGGDQTAGAGTGASDHTGAIDQTGAQGAGGGDQGQGGQGATGPKYLSQLPVEMRDIAAQELKDLSTLGDLVKDYMRLKKAHDPEAVILPKKDATPEAWQSFFAKLGVPDKPEGYQTGAFEHLPKGMKVIADEFANLMHLTKQTPNQAKALREGLDALFGEHNKAIEAHRADAIKAVEDEHKSDFKATVKTAEEVVSHIDPDLLKKLEAEGIKDVVFNSPAMVNVFNRASKAILEDSSLPGGPGGGQKKTQRHPITGAPMFNYDSPDMAKATAGKG